MWKELSASCTIARPLDVMRLQRSPLTIRGDYQVAWPPPTPLVLIANAAVNKCKTAANSRCFVCFFGNIRELRGCRGRRLFYCTTCGQHHDICWMLIAAVVLPSLRLCAVFVSISCVLLNFCFFSTSDHFARLLITPPGFVLNV